MENKVENEMKLLEEQKNGKEGEDFYDKILENMTEYAAKLQEFYNQIVVMRVESVKVKLDYLKFSQDLGYASSLIDGTGDMDQSQE